MFCSGMDLVCILEPNLQVEQTTGKAWVGSLSSLSGYTSGYRTKSGDTYGKQFTTMTIMKGTEYSPNSIFF